MARDDVRNDIVDAARARKALRMVATLSCLHEVPTVEQLDSWPEATWEALAKASGSKDGPSPETRELVLEAMRERDVLIEVDRYDSYGDEPAELEETG